ncbi:MAG: LptA/OstA family protein [Myxococcota bacterium]|nr:LptA/OstA family protein [Myxococcota bacterium]
MNWFITALALAFPQGMSGEKTTLSFEGLSVKGERFLWNGSDLEVTGHVLVDYEDFQIQSQTLTLQLNEERQILSASLAGQVVLKRGSWRGVANRVQWKKGESWISMLGSARLVDTQWEFQGERISFSVDTDQIECLNDCSIRAKPNP